MELTFAFGVQRSLFDASNAVHRKSVSNREQPEGYLEKLVGTWSYHANRTVTRARGKTHMVGEATGSA